MPPRGVDRLLTQVHRSVGVREGTGPPPPQRRGQHHVGQLGRLGREAVTTTRKSGSPASTSPCASQLRQRDRRVGAGHPQEADRALLDVPQQLHRVRGRRPVRDRRRVDVPEGGELGGRDVRSASCGSPGRSPSAPASRLFWAVGWPFICRTPRRGDRAPAQQVEVVDPDGGPVAWWDLVEALQHGRHHRARRCRRLGRRPRRRGPRPRRCRPPAAGRTRRPSAQCVEADGVGVDVLVVHPVVGG